jgi:hypothetical protein
MMIYRLWAPRARMPCPCASKEESIKLRGQMGRGTTPRRRMASFAAAKAGYHFRKVAVSSALMPFMRGVAPGSSCSRTPGRRPPEIRYAARSSLSLPRSCLDRIVLPCCGVTVLLLLSQRLATKK